jgi:hypothetical protein
MAGGDALGWIAAGLTVLTFSMRSMIALRTVAVAASVCFIAYGALGALYPVLALHLLLLPCNLLRLRQLRRGHFETALDIQKNDFDVPGVRPLWVDRPD